MTAYDSNISDADIQALIDNELNETKKRHVINYLKYNEAAFKRYLRLQYQKQLLKEWWKQTESH